MRRRVGMEEYENGTGRCAPGWCLVQRGGKRARASGGAGCEGTVRRRRAAIRRSGGFETAKRRSNSRFSPGLSPVRAAEWAKVKSLLVPPRAGRQDAGLVQFI